MNIFLDLKIIQIYQFIVSIFKRHLNLNIEAVFPPLSLFQIQHKKQKIT